MTVTLNPLYRFDTLVVGAANRLAVTAAKAVAESPGTVYNPLFIYARPGLGKTHLLMAIGHAAPGDQSRGSPSNISRSTSSSRRSTPPSPPGHGEAYRKRFLDVDLLLVDDVQFLTHRREMQAELLRLTDALQTASRQIVLTSDRPPAEIEALDERLIRRFAGGLDHRRRRARLRDPRRHPAPQGRGAPRRLRRRRARGRGRARHRQRARAARRAQPADRLPGRERAAARRRSRPACSWGGEVEASEPVDVGGRRPVEAVRPPAPATGRAVRVRGLPLGDLRHRRPAGRRLARQGDRRRAALAGRGVPHAQLEALLAQEMVNDPERSLREFEEDVERLQRMQAEAAALAPELAGSAAFRDPGRPGRGRGSAPAGPRGGRAAAGALAALAPGRPGRDRGQPGRARGRARVVAEPASRYNPLVLVGGGGGRQDPPAARDRQRARRARRARWRASARPSSPAS